MLKRFLSYVEIRTKLASVMPCLLGLLYARYAYGRLDLVNTALFAIAMLLFDMSTTALNNYMDTKSNGAPLQFTMPVARRILFVLLALASLAGLALAMRTGWIVLACGAACFLIGIIYTAGPAPLARMPVGEAFSGIFMGFFIPFLAVFINAPVESLVFFTLDGSVLMLSFNLADLLRLAILTVPPICGIAGIMLANNICDHKYDISIRRFTLPHYLGLRWSLRLFAFLYGLAFTAIIAIAAAGILPVYILVTLVAIVPVWQNITRFREKQVKKETFPLSVQNFMMIMVPMVFSALAAALLG